MKWVILFLIFLPVVNASSIGVSPNSIEFNSIGEVKQVLLFNPNEYDVAVSVDGVEGVNVEVERVLVAGGVVRALVRVDKEIDDIVVFRFKKGGEGFSVDAGVGVRILYKDRYKVFKGVLVCFLVVFCGLLFYLIINRRNK